MRADRIIVSNFPDFQVCEYQSVQEINEHAKAEIKGYIPFDRRDAYLELGRKQTWIQVSGVSKENEEIVFFGILVQLQIDVNGRTCFLNMHLRSGTYLMDLQEHNRSFQNISLTYSDILEKCNQDYDNAAKIMTVAKNKTIGCFLMQYQETDWEFIKRLASRNQSVVFADCFTQGTRYHFGIPDRREKDEEKANDYCIRCDMREYWIKKKQGIDIQSGDTVSYVLESRNSHKLGERKSVDGKELYIWKIESYLKGGELYHTCCLKPKAGFGMPVHYNIHMSGVSLLGNVKKVQNEEVQIDIFLDENKENSGNLWFPFSTVYSSSDGSGWYCMPEKGDKIRLYFPTADEQDAYVSSVCHETNTDLRQNPEIKFWRNKEGKEIRLSPDGILLTNNDGTYIELSDTAGINIVSQSSLSLRAGGSLKISSSSSSIRLNAPKKILLKQGETEMVLGGDLGMQGKRILL